MLVIHFNNNNYLDLIFYDFMRIAMAINWNLEASSLTNIARNNFRELGKLMNQTKSFTISAIGIQSVSVGDFNQHFDLLHIPNMGGYKFSLS